MLVDLSRYRYPITEESLQTLEPLKQLILEHKSQLDLLQRWIPQENTQLYSLISELYSQMATLEVKSRDHERYLHLRQCAEDLRENAQELLPRTKEEGVDVKEKYKLCQSLLIQLPLIKWLSEETRSKLQMISADLYSSQLNSEQRRLAHNEENLDSLQSAVESQLKSTEGNVLKDLDFDSECEATRGFLMKTQRSLQKQTMLDPSEESMKNEYRRLLTVKKTIEMRMRLVEIVGQNKGNVKGSKFQNLIDMKNTVLNQCDSQMTSISQAMESLRSYTGLVRQAVQFLRSVEVSMLPPQGSVGPCSRRLQETQQALASLQHHFQTHVEQIQNQVALHPCLSPQKVQELLEHILSQLLVRMSTLQAKGHMQLETLNRCSENQEKYNQRHDEIILEVKSIENSLSQVIHQKVTCLADCASQHYKLRTLCEEVEALRGRLEEQKEWCVEQSCCGGREATAISARRWTSRLLRCIQELTARSKQRIAEWSEITNSVEKASVVSEQVEAELPVSWGRRTSTEELQDLLQSWEQYQDRLDCEHRALSALELRAARLLGVPAHLEQAPPTPLCQRLQTLHARYNRVKQRSREGLEAARTELEVREKVGEELHGLQIWLQAAHGLLAEMEQSSNTEELQEVHSQLCSQKAQFQCIMDRLKMKYSDTLAPSEIQGQLQEVTQSLQQLEQKVAAAVERSGPIYSLGAKLSEIHTGLNSVQKRLEERSPTVTQAKVTQKGVWDELEVWHSCLAALEVDIQELEKPAETLMLMERLVEVQQLYSQLSKQAEQRTTLISKVKTWHQEHREMINSSTTWMAEAQQWLAAPCTYTTAKCLSSHVQALRRVLGDSVQIRSTLQGFGSVLKDMSQVCDTEQLQAQLLEADAQVADVQESFTAPLSQLEHAAAEVDAIESEVRQMQSELAEVEEVVSSPQTLPKHKEEKLKVLGKRIQAMGTTVAEIQRCKPDLCLPDGAEETLAVFSVVDQMQTLLQDLEKKVPALFVQLPPTPTQDEAPEVPAEPQPQRASPVEAGMEKLEQGQIRIARIESDALKRSGAELQTVKRCSPEQGASRIPPNIQIPVITVQEETDAASARPLDLHEGQEEDVAPPTDRTEERPPKAVATVTTQSVASSMASTEEPRPGQAALHGCLERVEQLELWLLDAQSSLRSAGGPASMQQQDGLERSLLTCQEMFLEIERKVAGLSALRQEAAGAQQEEAEMLSSKLEHLKSNLVDFQQLLQQQQQQQQQEEERSITQQQSSDGQSEPGPPSSLKRRSSVQEILSSPRNKLMRQSSLQQQKELGQELTEQMELTQALARQRTRGRGLSHDPEERSRQDSTRAPPAERDVDSAQTTWAHLSSRLLRLEESWRLPPCEVTDSSARRGDGTAGRVIGTQALKELRSYISQLRELGHAATQRLNQASPPDDPDQALDEGLFHVLYGVSLSLSSVGNLLRSPWGPTHEGDAQRAVAQLQTLSAELSALSSELASQGPKVTSALGSESTQQCVDGVSRVLSVVQAALGKSEEQLRSLQQDGLEKQIQLTELHAAFASNQKTFHNIMTELSGTAEERVQVVGEMQESLEQQVEQVSCLLEQNLLPPSLVPQASRLQSDLDGALGRICCQSEGMRSSVELQRLHERLVGSLEELLALGSQRLEQRPGLELRDIVELQQQYYNHTKFFQFLSHHSKMVLHLTEGLPESALLRWRGVVAGLQVEVERLQQRGLEKGVRMQETLQVWWRWEDDSAWSDSLLSDIQTSFPIMLWEGASEEQMADTLSVYQDHCDILQRNEARFDQMLEAGLRLQEAGFRGVGVATREKEARWKILHRKLQQEHDKLERKWTLRSRFVRDISTLAAWMDEAREMIDRWSELSEAEGAGVDQRRHDYLQAVALTKELESNTELKTALITAGTRLALLSESGSDSGRELEDPDSDLSSIQSRLGQMEQDWSSLLLDLPAVQHQLHKRWINTLSQQEALLELQARLEAASSSLQECRSGLKHSSSTAGLTLLLRDCKECQVEMSAHQATLDYVNQILQTCSTEEGRGRRYKHNQFAEAQGSVNYEWLSLQEALNSQVQELEQRLRSRTEREARLQQTSEWIRDRSRWMDSAVTPSSRAELRRNFTACQDLGEQISQKCAALQMLRDECDDGDQVDRCQFACSRDKTIQACVELARKNDSVMERLLQTQLLWDGACERLSRLALNTARTSQLVRHQHSSPQLWLQAHRPLHQQLQHLHEKTTEADAEWDNLSQSVAILRSRVSPAAAAVLTEQLKAPLEDWTVVSEQMEEQLQMSGCVLQVWDVYSQLATSWSQRLQTLQTEADAVLSAAPPVDCSHEQLAGRMDDVQVLLQRVDILQSDLEGVLEASKDLVGRLDPCAAVLVQSESRLLLRGVQQLSQALGRKLAHLQEELRQQQRFWGVLESLEASLEQWQEVLQQQEAQPAAQSGLLELSGLSADLDVLNELSRNLTLGDAAARRLQRLNRCWADTSARAEEACSEVQTELLRRQSFEQKCASWMSFLQRMEDSLTVDVAGSYTGLRQQLCTHKHFQNELSIGHQILHSVIAEALQLLQRGEVEDRSDFILKLAQLREHWQGAVQRADQRRSLVEGLVRHWHLYRHSLRKLQRFLSDTQSLLPTAGLARCSLQQLRRSLHDLQHTELLFQRYQSTFIHTLDVGRQLFSMGDEGTQNQLQADLGTLQEEWDNLHGLLGRRMDLIEAIIQNWERCEAGLEDSMLQLKDMKTRLNRSMPESDDELQSAEFNKEDEDSLEYWAERLTELSAMKTDLSQYIIADDVLLLQEQVEHLHCQWEELCLKVSLRKQEIADRLNAWIIFNEKNKELCEWLTQMENKVAHNSDLNIEEMVEKLKKDCMEEINLFSENKTHLKQLGEQLITASNKTKETEINDKLKDINDRWQHLFDHIEARVRKLKDTLVTVQQLDKKMSNLRTWLSCIEAELAKPVVYSVCHSDEIKKQLAELQDLQRDIEQHTESVASVLTLCDVLLHDADACGSDSESDSIQQTSHSLDRRWRNICAMSLERRMRIEETWRLWSKFLDDYSRFEEWLKAAEITAGNPDSANVLYTSAKEELKKFEAFQRQVHERLTQLELVNKQYRRLARENRTDAACKLKIMVQEGNQRWDSLQKRVASVLRRLKHFTSQREDFEGTREGILVWLTEMDLQLTNVEHFSESDIEDKMRQLNGFQQEITLNTNKIDALIVFGENLIQKSAPLDAALIEDELEELHSYCQEVFGRVARFHHRLVNRRPILLEETEPSDHDTDPEDSQSQGGRTVWRKSRRKRKTDEEELAAPLVSAGQPIMCHLLAPPLERSGRETPVSVDSIPLEWDHTVDVGGSSSHEDDEDDATFFSTLSVKSGDRLSWHQPGSPERREVSSEDRTSPETHTFHQQGYAKLMSECSSSIDSVKRVKLILNDEEELEDPGLTVSTADKQTSTGVIQRWELLGAPKFTRDEADDVKHDLEHWHKLNSDLSDVTSWLGRVLPELENLQRIEPSTRIGDFEVNVQRLKEMQKAFNSHKCLMISINLGSCHFQRGDSAELQELREALTSANHSWTQACSGLESWEGRLHSALMQCQEFHETLHSLLLWLAQAEGKLSTVNLGDPSTPSAVLLQHRVTLVKLQEELSSRQQEVSSLREISSQLLLEAAGEDSVEAKEKVHVICNKLRLLLRQVAADLHVLQRRLESCSAGSEVDSMAVEAHGPSLLQHHEVASLQKTKTGQPATRRDDRRDSPPRRPLLYRVLRAAFPLHLLFFMLLVLACLVPLTEEDYSCAYSNNFARSFYPMLRYTNGPPPT